MKLVLDSSVGFKWQVRETDSDRALRIRNDFLTGVVDLLAPDVYAVEIAHSPTRAERQGRITPSEGAVRMQDSLTLLPDLHAYLPLLPRAYEISSQTRQGRLRLPLRGAGRAGRLRVAHCGPEAYHEPWPAFPVHQIALVLAVNPGRA